MNGHKVLIVDDDKDVLKALSIRLRANGYGVVFAADGIAAISVARNETPDVIILDIGLPGGDGFTVMERLGGLVPTAQIPVIILTGRDVAGNEARARDAGAHAFLQKPIDDDVLLETIREALGESDGLEPTRSG